MSRRDSKSKPPAAVSPKKSPSIERGRLIGSNRDWLLLIAFAIAAVILVLRLGDMQILSAAELRAEAQEQRTITITIPAKRGTIYDRNGNVLAMNIDATTIYANPAEIEDPKSTAAVLADVLGGNTDDYYQKLCADGTFVYIKQKAEVSVAQTLMERETALKAEAQASLPENNQSNETVKTALHGIYYLKDSKRVYPYGSIGAQVIGAVDPDNRGTYGLELMYDSVLRGSNGTLQTEYSLQVEHRPMSGHPIPGALYEKVAPVSGSDIIITVDIDLQEYLEAELARVGTERECEKGNVLVLDGGTGEIYATASLPLVDRDNLTQEDVDKGATTLQSITFAYEPGSTFKAFTIAAVLEEGVMAPQDKMTVPGWRQYAEMGFGDAIEHDEQEMTLVEILAESSNVGTSYAKDRMDDARYYDYLMTFGCNAPTNIDFPGEGFGTVDSWENWSDVQSGTISFGQGIKVTSLEMAMFYGAIANDGVLWQPHFLLNRPQSKEDQSQQYGVKDIMSARTAQLLREMLAYAVSNGTGKSAQIKGYAVAGKTGTAEKADPKNPANGYIEGEYIVSFVGFLSQSDSKLVCITSMDNPIGADGNAPTGSLFASIMRFVANRYMIEPLRVNRAVIASDDSSGAGTAGTAGVAGASGGGVAGGGTGPGPNGGVAGGGTGSGSGDDAGVTGNAGATGDAGAAHDSANNGAAGAASDPTTGAYGGEP